jgi:4-hydroxy-2-oxoheptanedioate aldolase
MLRNRIREAVAQGRKAKGFHLSFPAPRIVELYGRRGGFDFAYLDGEHGAFDLAEIEEFCRTCDLVGLTPIARIPEIGQGTVSRFLDRGMLGIIAPHVRSAADAAALVKACRYAPLGERSYGNGRSERFGVGIADLPAFCRHWNETVWIGAMLEDRAALDDLDAILAVPGIDCFMIGAFDFAQAMGRPGEPAHPEVEAAMTEIGQRVRAAGKTMREDVIEARWINDLLLDAADRFLDG